MRSSIRWRQAGRRRSPKSITWNGKSAANRPGENTTGTVLCKPVSRLLRLLWSPNKGILTMKIRRTPAYTLLALLLAGVSATSMAEEKFTFLTNWYAQAEHGGFYQAQAKGLYKTAGLDVSIKMGGPQVNVMQLMAAGQADCTLGDNGQATETWQAGVHAVTVATVFQHSRSEERRVGKECRSRWSRED